MLTSSEFIWRSCSDTRRLSITQRVGRCLFVMLSGDGIRRASPQISVDAPKMWIVDAGLVSEFLSVLLFLMRDYGLCLSKLSRQHESWTLYSDTFDTNPELSKYLQYAFRTSCLSSR